MDETSFRTLILFTSVSSAFGYVEYSSMSLRPSVAQKSDMWLNPAKGLFLSSTCLLTHRSNFARSSGYDKDVGQKKLRYCIRRMENVVLMLWLLCACSSNENARKLLDMHFSSSVQLDISLVSAANEWDIELNMAPSPSSHVLFFLLYKHLTNKKKPA